MICQMQLLNPIMHFLLILSPKSWDTLGTNDVEEHSYVDLHENGKAGAESFGLNDDIWDCHINHYYGYWWSDLEESGFDQYLIVLGWDENGWDDDGSAPESDDSYWDDLTPEEQSAASQICYFKDLWDGVPIPEWEYLRAP